MKLKMSDRTLRIVKLLWLPVLLIVLIAADSVLKISQSSYAWAFIGLQIALFLAYTYILFKDRPKYVPSAERVIKGKRKPKK